MFISLTNRVVCYSLVVTGNSVRNWWVNTFYKRIRLWWKCTRRFLLGGKFTSTIARGSHYSVSRRVHWKVGSTLSIFNKAKKKNQPNLSSISFMAQNHPLRFSSEFIWIQAIVTNPPSDYGRFSLTVW